MNCKVASQMISSLLDGELSLSERARLNEHIDRCPGCRAELRQTEIVKVLIQRSAHADPPADFEARLLSACHRSQVRRQRRFETSTLMLSAAGAGLAVLILLAQLGARPSSAQPERTPPVGFELEHDRVYTVGGDPFGGYAASPASYRNDR